ncbi:hypothetical protein M8J75_002472 [Diaphorina citri]|nr:hypothetical protein M8J75_002472 [Diaphorina citri]KAI5752484.1 hypothetical protein M8J77_017383 [Diaphorina citri]
MLGSRMSSSKQQQTSKETSCCEAIMISSIFITTSQSVNVLGAKPRDKPQHVEQLDIKLRETLGNSHRRGKLKEADIQNTC